MDKTLKAVLAATATFFLVTAVLAAVFVFCRRGSPGAGHRRRRHRHRSAERAISAEMSLSFEPSMQQQISMDKIVAATRNFAAELIVGDGSFGLVYRAQLPDGRSVAVKKLDPDAFQGLREFRAEIETLGKLHHPNLIRILGFCVSGADRALVYEFVEHGSLDFWLHEHEHSVEQRLSWAVRMRVAAGVAKGLAYLHGLPNPVIHRDIKASNVLLDAAFRARIADFGLARILDASHSHVSTQASGTMGYMPPEYKEGFTVATVKADVYSFGVLLIEMATARRPNLPSRYQGDEESVEMGLVQWARRMIAQGRYLEMLDPCVASTNPEPQVVEEYFRIACLCAEEMHPRRPAMRDVVRLLHALQPAESDPEVMRDHVA